MTTLQRLSIALFASCLLATSLPAEEDALSGLIEETAKSISSIQTLRETGVWKMEFDMEGMKQKTEMEVAVVFERPRRLYFKSQHMMVVCDGSNAFVRIPMAGKYYQTPVKEGLSELLEGSFKAYLLGMLPDKKALLAADAAAVLRDAAKDAQIEILDDEQFGDRDCRVIKFRAQKEGGAPWMKQALKVWLDKESGMIRRIESLPLSPEEIAEAEKEDGENARVAQMMKSLRYTFELTESVVNGPVTDEDFKFTPAPGDKKVETEMGLGMGGALGGGEGFTRFELSGKPAPEFSLKLLDKEESFSLSAHTGSVVLIDFWATWCGPCVKALPEVKKLHDLYGTNGLVIVGVSRDRERDTEKVREMLAKQEIAYPVGMDFKNIASDYKVEGIPCMVLVDRSGVVQGRKVGFSSSGFDSLKKDIEAVLEGKTIPGAEPLTEAELKDLQEESVARKSRATMRGNTQLNTNWFRVRWERSVDDVRERATERVPVSVRIPPRVLVSRTESEAFVLDAESGATNAVIPLPPEARVANEMEQYPSLSFIRTPDGGRLVAMQMFYKVTGEDSRRSYTGDRTEVRGINVSGGVVWTNSFGKDAHVRSVEALPVSDKEDVLLVSTWNRLILLNADGKTLVSQQLDHRDRMDFHSRPDSPSGLGGFIQGRRSAAFDLVIPAEPLPENP